MPHISRCPIALPLILAACAQSEATPDVGRVEQSLAEHPAYERSLWDTDEGRVIHYFIDEHRTVASLSPTQDSCHWATSGAPDLPSESVTNIRDAIKRYEDQTPLRFHEVTHLPLKPDGTTLYDPGY